MPVMENIAFQRSSGANLRAVLYPDGANLFETLLTKVTALREKIHPAPLEVLIFVQIQLH